MFGENSYVNKNKIRRKNFFHFSFSVILYSSEQIHKESYKIYKWVDRTF